LRTWLPATINNTSRRHGSENIYGRGIYRANWIRLWTNG